MNTQAIYLGAYYQPYVYFPDVADVVFGSFAYRSDRNL